MSSKKDRTFIATVRNTGIPWRGVIERLKAGLPEVMTDRDSIAHHNVSRAMNEIFGEAAWKTDKRPSKSEEGQNTLWIVLNGDA